MQRAPFISIGLLLLAGLTSDLARSDELKDLYFGEALYYAHQGDYFGALERLDTEVRQHVAVDERQLPANLRVTHKSLFDGTLQGIHRTDRDAFSFQGHPEASPGPQDCEYLFDQFVEMMEEARGGKG